MIIYENYAGRSWSWQPRQSPVVEAKDFNEISQKTFASRKSDNKFCVGEFCSEGPLCRREQKFTAWRCCSSSRNFPFLPRPLNFLNFYFLEVDSFKLILVAKWLPLGWLEIRIQLKLWSLTNTWRRVNDFNMKTNNYRVVIDMLAAMLDTSIKSWGGSVSSQLCCLRTLEL